jgi:hypothetical protein
MAQQGEKSKQEVLRDIHNKLRGHDYIRELNDGYKRALSDLTLLKNVGYFNQLEFEHEKAELANVYLQAGLKMDE